MSVLPMDDGTVERVRELARRAARKENWYRAGESAVPGDSPTYAEQVGSYKVVFTWTKHPREGMLRHMSMSSRQRLPAPEAVFTVAHWLGFTGAAADGHGVVLKPAPDWIVGPHHVDRCVVVAQRITEEDAHG